MLLHESFGLCTGLRPANGDGRQISVYDHPNIDQFWIEYPGSGSKAWMSPGGTQTWAFARVAGDLDPYELPSPLQSDLTRQGVAYSEFFDAILEWPTALVRFTPPAAAYEVSAEGSPGVKAGAYLSIGLSGSPVLLSNFKTVGQASLTLRYQDPSQGPGSALVYELRVGTSVVHTGLTSDVTWNRLSMRIDPATGLLSASVNGVSTGAPVSAAVAPTYAGFEGVGVLDNFVIRRAP